MPPLKLTKKDIRYIKNNRLKMSGSDMAKCLKVSSQVVTRFMRNNGLAVSKKRSYKLRAQKMTGRTSASESHDVFLKENYMSMRKKQSWMQ